MLCVGIIDLPARYWWLQSHLDAATGTDSTGVTGGNLAGDFSIR